mmetsp:Transcript_6824/g.13116  ORF Transcript_6824/g.13116 Transcript_6824/m.13116 type:complete len:217 (+) Transcript_6824:1337-1987(+)
MAKVVADRRVICGFTEYTPPYSVSAPKVTVWPSSTRRATTTASSSVSLTSCATPTSSPWPASSVEMAASCFSYSVEEDSCRSRALSACRTETVVESFTPSINVITYDDSKIGSIAVALAQTPGSWYRSLYTEVPAPSCRAPELLNEAANPTWSCEKDAALWKVPNAPVTVEEVQSPSQSLTDPYRAKSTISSTPYTPSTPVTIHLLVRMLSAGSPR